MSAEITSSAAGRSTADPIATIRDIVRTLTSARSGIEEEKHSASSENAYGGLCAGEATYQMGIDLLERILRRYDFREIPMGMVFISVEDCLSSMSSSLKGQYTGKSGSTPRYRDARAVVDAGLRTVRKASRKLSDVERCAYIASSEWGGPVVWTSTDANPSL
jgi:hypothetical protein